MARRTMARPAKSNRPAKRGNDAGTIRRPDRPARAEAEAAVRTLLRWAGDDPDREGLLGTPERVVRAYEEWYAGYDEDPRDYLKRTFEEVAGYDEIVLLRDVRFVSHCEHHMAPIIGRVHIAYLPRHRVVGISKLIRLVDAYAKRLQGEEKVAGGDRVLPRCRPQAARRRGRRRGRARVHDHARRAPQRGHHGDEPHARRVSRSATDARRISLRDRAALGRAHEQERRLTILMAHVLLGEPVPTSPGHALRGAARLAWPRRARQAHHHERAGAEARVDAHRAAVQLDQGFGDREPQAGALVALRVLALDLLEGAAEAGEGVARNADAGIADRD